MAKPTRSQRKTKGLRRMTPVRLRTLKPVGKAVNTIVPPESVEQPALPPVWRLAWQAGQLLWRERVFFALFWLIYLLLDLLLVRSIVAFDAAGLKAGLDDSLRHGAGLALGSFSVFSSLFTAALSGAAADTAGAYRFFFSVLMSLAVIWSLRQLFTETDRTGQLRLKAAFYRSTGQLVPFLLLVLLLAVQLLPLLVATTLYSIVVGTDIANSLPEQLFFLIILLAVATLTLVWLARTVVSLYVVTLDGMEPRRAYQNAKTLVRGRRLGVIRKLLFLPLLLFVLTGLIIVPTIMLWAPLAQWLFFVLTGLGFIYLHTYLYTLYRELLV